MPLKNKSFVTLVTFIPFFLVLRFYMDFKLTVLLETWNNYSYQCQRVSEKSKDVSEFVHWTNWKTDLIEWPNLIMTFLFQTNEPTNKWSDILRWVPHLKRCINYYTFYNLHTFTICTNLQFSEYFHTLYWVTLCRFTN